MATDFNALLTELVAAYTGYKVSADALLNGNFQFLSGTLTDPDSFNSAGGKTGDLGYYALTNGSGTTIYVPCLQRLAALSSGAAPAFAAAAEASATAAAASAGTATTKAGQASTSATAAAGSATAASGNAGTATTKAGEASASATAAAGSATAASGSAGTATTKAGEASASATSAGNSATAAANSATAAAASAAIADRAAGGVEGQIQYNLGGVLTGTANLTYSANALIVGAGGTGSAAPQLTLNGGSGANAGGYIRFNKNGATLGYLGHESGMDGGGSTSNTIILQSTGGLKFRTANVDRVIVDAVGNFGIGRNPNSAGDYRTLDIDGPSGGYISLRQAGTTYGVAYANSGQVVLQANGAIPLLFLANGAERMRVNANGFVGIGTDNPARALEVQTVGGAPVARFASPGGTARIELSANAASQVDIALGASANIASAAPGMIRYDNPGDYMAFLTGATERVRIDTAGKVGIGAAPTVDFDVAKTVAGGGVQSRLANSGTGASAFARQQLLTGTANSFVNMTLADNAGAPYYQLQAGSAVGTLYSDFNEHIFRSQSGAIRAVINGNGVQATGTIRPGSFTVATLPSASAVGDGATARVTDATAATYRSVVAGGGSNKINVVSNGTQWLIGA